MKGRHAALHDHVDEVLLRDWDPIGVAAFPAAHDEYRTYVSRVVAMLLDCETEASIAAHLEHIATVNMNLPADPERAARIARLLAEAKAQTDGGA